MMRSSRLGAREPTLLKLSRRRRLMDTAQRRDCLLPFLLEKADLVKYDETYLKPICEKEFIKKFGETPPVDEIYHRTFLRRLAIVLPLQVSNNMVVPIPFIIDTGAPKYLYLGPGAFDSLEKGQRIVDVISIISPYRLFGTLTRGEKLFKNPLVERIPSEKVEASIREDVRSNILGLNAIKNLDIWHY